MTENSENCVFGRWFVEWLAGDGGRIGRLCYDGLDLLTTRPAEFRPPADDYGQYELRAVYGYDDCMPTVDPCDFPPDPSVKLPDHGEVCWLDWQVEVGADRLEFTVDSKLLTGLSLKRTMVFSDAGLSWQFELANASDQALPVQHVMHPLMLPQNVKALALPEFASLWDDIAQKKLDLTRPEQVAELLVNQPAGVASMLFLRDISDGSFAVEMRNGLKLDVAFPAELFDSIGIWWNTAGYPEEQGLRRMEFAIEPVPGPISDLAKSYPQGGYLNVLPGESISWNIDWTISQ